MRTLKLLVVFGFIISCHGLNAAIYYVDQAHSSADDANPGTDESQPWKTINKAAKTLVAGDIVYIKEGTYIPASRINMKFSGTAGNYITYSAYPGHNVIIDGTNVDLTNSNPTPPNWYGVITVANKQYIKITGLKVINSAFAGIFVADSEDIIIENNKTYHTDSSGIQVWGTDNVIIDGNEVQKAGIGIWQECITVSGSENVEIMNNHVFDGGKEGIDAKDGCTNVKIYNNHVHNVDSVGIYVDAYSQTTSNISVFNNVVHHNYDTGIAICSEVGGLLENVRVFNNVIYNNGARGIVIGWNNNSPLENIRIFNNTCYKNYYGIAAYTLAGSDIIIKNNIVSQNTDNQLYKYYSTNAYFVNNLVDGAGSFLGNDPVSGSPAFEDAENGIFSIQSNSAAIDNGAYIAQTIASGSGTVVPVTDATVFLDDPLDFTLKVIIGDKSPVKLLSVDYTNSTIKIDTNLTWNAGDNVNYAYTKNAPDLGAKEYDVAIAGHWRFDLNASDSSLNSNHGAVYGNPFWNSNGMLGGSLIFDGVDDYVDCYNGDELKPGQDDFTIECWVKPTSLPTSYAGIIFKGNGNLSNQDGWLLRYLNGKIYFHMGDGTNSLGGLSINYVLPLNEWTHVTLVVDRDAGYFAYINGQFINSYAINTSSADVNGPSLRIGRDWSTSDYFFTGEIDNVRIHQRALSADDVSANYVQKYDIVGHWKFDGNASDDSPYLNNGAVYGNPTWNTGGVIDGALVFDGVDDYIDCYNNDVLKPGKDDFSVEFWIKPTSLPSSYAGILFKGNGNLNNQDGWLLRYLNGKIYFHMGDGTNNLGGLSLNYVLPLNEWTHVTLVVDRDCGYFAYINGQFISSYAIDTSAYEVNGPSLRIGRDWSTSDYFFTGELDNVKIYRKALSSSEILINYTQ